MTSPKPCRRCASPQPSGTSNERYDLRHRPVIHARHGVMDHETEVGQRFVIDLELSADLSESSRTDRLADTVSYSNVVATATAAFKDTNYKLLERAAGAVADADPRSFPRIIAVKVTVHKPHAPIAAIFDDVGVTLTRDAAATLSWPTC